MAPEGWSRILVIRLSSLGDVARMLPALASLKSGGRIVDVTVEDRFAGLFGLFPIPDRVIPYPRKSAGSLLRHPLAWSRAFASYAGSMREGRYDLALDLHGILRSALLARLSGAKETAGYGRGFGKEGSHLFYDHAVLPGPLPRISRYERYAGTLEALGFPRPGPDYLRFEAPAEAEEEVRSFLVREGLAEGRYVLAFIGTSRAQAFKRWPTARFLELARMLWERKGLPTVLGWGPDEEEEINSLGQAEGLHVAPDWRLAPLVYAISRAKAFIGADTGAMHLSALVGVPTLALMGPTDPVVNRPFGDRYRLIFREGVTRPCAGPSCTHEACMGALSAEKAFKALEELLADAASPARAPEND
jgi:heptosyltransferase-1